MNVLYSFTIASLGIKIDATWLQLQSVNVMELPQIQSDLSQNLRAGKVWVKKIAIKTNFIWAEEYLKQQ
jgi:hypothetical protein